ncbi:MAG: hypothetical protein HYV63_11950 [Candidatus Schekmanbacteria bacterium]|nr:hypothetical protein [Candidatus Schekmanbacteria bacterium]
MNLRSLRAWVSGVVACGVVALTTVAAAATVDGDLSKWGPMGGSGGEPFDDSSAVGKRSPLKKIIIRTGSYVDGITIQYKNGEVYTHSKDTGGTNSSIEFPDGCWLQEVIAAGGAVMDKITLTRKCLDGSTYSISGGGSGGSATTWTAASGYEIGGFYGALGSYVDRLGVITRLQPSVVINGPGDWTSYIIGGSQQIEWQTNDGIHYSDKVQISVDRVNDCTGDGPFTQIATVDNTGSYLWSNIPGPGADPACVRVAWNQDPLVYSEVNAKFPAMWLTSPVGGEKWQVGSGHAIQFDNVGLWNTATAELSRDGGVSYATINPTAAITANGSSSFDWTVTEPITTTARIRLTWSNDGRVQATSPSSFSILPAIRVTFPNGGESLVQNYVHTLTWSAQGMLASEKVGLSVDCGGTVQTLAGDALNTGTYEWKPLSTCASAKLKVTWSGDSSVYDESDSTWQIMETPEEMWTIGSEVTRPGGTLAQMPNIVLQGSDTNSPWTSFFAWSNVDDKLYTIAPVAATIRWASSSGAGTVDKTGVSVWPASPQIHVLSSPASPESTGVSYKFLKVGYTTAGAKVESGEFKSTQAGYTVIHYTAGTLGDVNVESLAFEVVKTVSWNQSGVLSTDANACVIGSNLTGSAYSHNDPDGKNGYVYFATSRYDGAIHDRAKREGEIFPVNKYDSNMLGPQDPMVVVWYVRNAKNIAWPSRPVQYTCNWPDEAGQGVYSIVIASQLGSAMGSQPTLDFAQQPTPEIYSQDDTGQPGYNPNEEHAFISDGVVWAIRQDLGSVAMGKATSLPYVLVKYWDTKTTVSTADDEWAFYVYKVAVTNATYPTLGPITGEAGKVVQPIVPLSYLSACTETYASGDPKYIDHNGVAWAKAAGALTVNFYYPLQPGFYYDLNGDGVAEKSAGECVPWLSYYAGTPTSPVNFPYTITWPADVPTLLVGETLMTPKRGLPNIKNQQAAKVAYDGESPSGPNADAHLATLYEPLTARTVSLDELPLSELKTDLKDGLTTIEGSADGSVKLNYALRVRVYYDPIAKALGFKGHFDNTGDYISGDPLLLPNVMTASERDALKGACLSAGNCVDYKAAVDALYDLTRNPNQIDLNGDSAIDKKYYVGYKNDNGALIVDGLNSSSDKALAAGTATGTGYLTLAFNDEIGISSPVSLTVIKVDCEDTNANAIGDGVYRGQIQVIPSDNVFDEQLTLRHSADFAGLVEALTFEWYAKFTTEAGAVPDDGEDPVPAPWLYQGGGDEGVELTIGGANLRTLADSDYIVRYQTNPLYGGPAAGPGVCPEQLEWSPWAGNPGSTVLNRVAKLGEGWVKRVIKGLNLFDSRYSDFHKAAAATYVSMIEQAGRRYEGDIAFNGDASNLNSIGLIESYTTVLKRAKMLSIDGIPAVSDHDATNQALLLVASRIADLYALLGNEAFADALDPTIGFSTDSLAYGNMAPSIFAFMNQVSTLLEEEVELLRGRDSARGVTSASPLYNRLVWNFTTGEGEVAYQQIYNMLDRNSDGFINESDAAIMYPQGHGDAWGHYLTGIKTYYDLLRHPNFNWQARAESINVAGTAVPVDFLDERKFATLAANKARTGAHIVNLVYKQVYEEDPKLQWQGYPDEKTVLMFDSTGQPAYVKREWGLEGWGRRAAQGAYFDWLTANAVIPEKDTISTGIQKIDRTTVAEIAEIALKHDELINEVDKAGAGLNPLGFAKGVVPFDIDPAAVDGGETHFEQIYQRFLTTLRSCTSVFNNANSSSQMLRKNQDDLQDFTQGVQEQERDYKNRLIEIFGTPYTSDIGSNGTFPDSYDGPDIYHYMIVDRSGLTGESMPTPDYYQDIQGFFKPMADGTFFPGNDGVSQDAIEGAASSAYATISYRVSLDDFSVLKPESWGSSVRKSPGELQRIMSDMYRMRADLTEAIDGNYGALMNDMRDKANLIKDQFNLSADVLEIKSSRAKKNKSLNVAIGVAYGVKVAATHVREATKEYAESIAEGIPKVVGLATDATSVARGAIKLASAVGQNVLRGVEGVADVAGNSMGLAKEDLAIQSDLEIDYKTSDFELKQSLAELTSMLRTESAARTKIFTMTEELEQLKRDFNAKLAEGFRLQQELVAFRRKTAAKVQAYRYQDMAFRVFRNDSLQKYRAQFDATARIAWLAATAFDYETNLLGTNEAAGRKFLTDIVRHRALGQLVADRSGGDPMPMPGSNGLAGVMGIMKANFDVLKTQLGFNNPQTEANRFSLREEHFRIRPDSKEKWVEALKSSYVPDLWQIKEFRRYCRPFAPEYSGAQPALVIPFDTTVTYGLNFFGEELGPGDSSYDTTHFATKIRSVGVWFGNYNALGLSNTPRIYLVPVGADVLRSPSADDFTVRLWRVVDQVMPVPFAMGPTDLAQPAWLPSDNMVGNMGDVRRAPMFRAYDESEEAEAAESRLIGRSVWNENWLLIIPGGTFLADEEAGLKTFIEGPCANAEEAAATCARTGEGITDIKLNFQTYAYSGN